MRDSFKGDVKLPPEQQAIRNKCFHPSGTFVNFPKKKDVETPIRQRFEKIAWQYPDGLAVKMGNCAFTYQELNQRANRVVHVILDHRGSDDEPIVFMCEDQVYQITAILGVLKAARSMCRWM